MTIPDDPYEMTIAQRHAHLLPAVNVGFVADMLIWTLLFEGVDPEIIRDARALKKRAIESMLVRSS
jgi:urease alpha subunit